MSLIDDEDRIYAARCAEALDGWPFDADRADPLTDRRIPVTSSHPGWYFLASFDRDSADRPDGAETEMLASYIDFLRAGFTERYQRALLARPLDVESGGNTRTFHKYGPGDWGYRQQTWDRGPTFFPAWPNYRAHHPDERYSVGPFALAELLEHICTAGGVIAGTRWQEWKAAHAEVFA